MSVRRIKHLEKVEQVRDWLISFFGEHPLFQKHTLDHLTEVTENSVGIKLKLVPGENTYADSFFVYEPAVGDENDENEEKGKLVARINMIESDIGKATGFFLFYLQLLIAVLSRANEITLDNDTNNAGRARRGIYKMFRVNDRGMTYSEWRHVKAKSWAVKPEMYHKVGRLSLPQIKRNLIEKIGQVVQSSTDVWREDAVDTMLSMFRKLDKTFNLYGGGRTRRKRTQRRVRGFNPSMTRSKWRRR